MDPANTVYTGQKENKILVNHWPSFYSCYKQAS